MKSLSILILLGALAALIVGGLFVVTPVLAEVNSPAEPVAPLTDDTVAVDLAPDASIVELSAEEPVSVAVPALSVDIAKDFAAQQEIEAEQAAQAEAAAAFNAFIASVANGEASQVTGIYVDGVLANAVVGQPNSNPAYVSEAANVVTHFEMAAQYGSQAFLAHNFLAGASFSQISVGQIITLVYGDGSTANFQIQTILRYQALSPTSTLSRFVDLGNGSELSASELFYAVYNSENPVVLQTCIENEGNSSWGRLFVQATPILDTTVSVTAP
jgi:hypothetical protein